MTPRRIEYDREGLRLVGDLWDNGRDAPAVVLSHGGGQTRHSWRDTAARLAAGGHTVVSYDARGHGDSGWDPAGDYSLDAFAGDVLAIAGTFSRPPVLVGASLGGIASLTASGEHPGAARGLVLVDVVVDVDPAGVSRILAFMREHASQGFGSLEEVADAIHAYNPARPRPANLDGLRKNVRLRDDGRWYWHWDPAFLSDDDETRSTRRSDRLRAAAAKLSVPTLIIRGGRSDVVSEDGMRTMLELVPGARGVDVEAAGHMVAGDNNDVFATALTSFLADLG